MRRIAQLLAIVCALSLSGCGLPGWYRSIGHFPGVAPSDYAFYTYWSTSSQLYQFPLPQVVMSAREALGDLGFKMTGPPRDIPDGSVQLDGFTPDGRTTEVLISPQNNLTNMRIKIGPVCIGDAMLSHDVFKRVSLNFGTAPRSYTPLEPVLSRRINHPPSQVNMEWEPRYETLIGEGLRPGDTRGTVTDDANREANPPSDVPSMVVPGISSWYFAPPPIIPIPPGQ